MPVVVNMHAAKSSLSRLVAKAAAGEQIFIARNGKPVALLTRLPQTAKPSRFGVLKGKLEIAPDFDAPLAGFEDYV